MKFPVPVPPHRNVSGAVRRGNLTIYLSNYHTLNRADRLPLGFLAMATRIVGFLLHEVQLPPTAIVLFRPHDARAPPKGGGAQTSRGIL